jgi:hypothetical protein
VIGFAAFSPSSLSSTQDPVTSTVTENDLAASARVASAVLALRFSDAETRIATTEPQTAAPGSPTTTTDPLIVSDDPEVTAEEPTAVVELTQDSTTTTSSHADTTPPPLRITSHDDGDTVTSRIVTFEGTSEPGATVASGPFAADMSENGDWQIGLVVVDGANGATFSATDEASNTTDVRVVVHYNEPSPTTTKAPATTTTKPSTTTTTKTSTTTTTPTPTTSSKWSPNWPADAGGIRDVEYWRSTLEKYWPANRVDCALGIIQRESKGDPRAFNSSSSAEGLMQHLNKYWHSRAVGAGFIDSNGKVATPYNGAANIAAGAYLANYYDNAIGQWWNPWKSGSGNFTAQYGTCQSSNPS